jgi:hypothetical protein
MGGFVIDPQEDSSDRFLPPSYGGYVTLTTGGVNFLLEHAPELIPHISEESIMDHSKADRIAKMLQLLQVSWFCISCVSRRAKGLPLSLLEVYTLAHATSMLVVYIIWLKKPLDIKEPTFIRGEFAREMCALILCEHSARFC